MGSSAVKLQTHKNYPFTRATHETDWITTDGQSTYKDVGSVPVTGDFAYHTPLQVSLSSQDALADFDREYTGGFIEKQQRPGRPVTRDASDLPIPACAPGSVLRTWQRKRTSPVERRRVRHLRAVGEFPLLENINERYFSLYDLLLATPTYWDRFPPEANVEYRDHILSTYQHAI